MELHICRHVLTLLFQVSTIYSLYQMERARPVRWCSLYFLYAKKIVAVLRSRTNLKPFFCQKKLNFYEKSNSVLANEGRWNLKNLNEVILNFLWGENILNYL